MDTRKLFLVGIDLFAAFLLFIYIWQFISFFFLDSPLISKIAWLILFGAFLFVMSVAISTYLVCLDNVLTGPTRALAPLLVGVGVLQFVIIQHFEILETPSIKLLAAVLVLWFWFRGYVVSRCLAARFPVPEHELRKVVSVLPPKSFHDMWLFHIFIITVLVLVPYVARLSWGALA